MTAHQRAALEYIASNAVRGVADVRHAKVGLRTAEALEAAGLVALVRSEGFVDVKRSTGIRRVRVISINARITDAGRAALEGK